MSKRQPGYAAGRQGYAKRIRKAPRVPRGPLLPSGAFRAYGKGWKSRDSTNEVKFFDTALSFAYDATGEVPATGQLTLIPQGVTGSTRVGRKCIIKSIQMRLVSVFVPAADTIGVSNCYLYVVQDRQANGQAAGITDVLTSNAMAAAMINMANSERFRVLRRFVFKLQAAAGVQTGFARDTCAADWYTKCHIPIEFSGTAGTIDELKSNNIFLLAGTDSNSDDTVSVTGTCRLRFDD